MSDSTNKNELLKELQKLQENLSYTQEYLSVKLEEDKEKVNEIEIEKVNLKDITISIMDDLCKIIGSLSTVVGFNKNTTLSTAVAGLYGVYKGLDGFKKYKPVVNYIKREKSKEAFLGILTSGSLLLLAGGASLYFKK